MVDGSGNVRAKEELAKVRRKAEDQVDEEDGVKSGDERHDAFPYWKGLWIDLL